MPTISQLVRRFLASLIVDVIVEFLARRHEDPAFAKAWDQGMAELGKPGTEEENHARAKALRDLINT